MNKKQQLKFNKLLTIYNDKLNQFIINNKLDDSPDYVLNCILSADPDIIGKNSKWLINNTLNGNILWEDIESGKDSKSYDTLNRFLAIRKQFTDNKLKDINQFHRLGDIAQQLRGYEVIQSNKSIKEEEKQQIYSETEFLYNENGYLVVSPKTERASCFWGLNTEWCNAATKSKNYFNHYNNKSPLYICIKQNGRKYQFHKDSEPMDENDKEIKNIVDPILRQLAFITGQIDNIKEINYNNEYKSKLAVQQNGWHIQYIDKKLPNYEELCKIAVQQNGLTIKHIDRKLPYYKECCKLAIQQNGNVIHLLDKDMPYYEEYCNLVCEQDDNFIQFINKNISNYEECCRLAVKQKGVSIQYVNKNLPCYEECCKLACQQDGYSIYHIDKNLPYYEELCKLAIQQDGKAIQFIDSNLSNYKELCKLAVQQNPSAINHIKKYMLSTDELFNIYKIAVNKNVKIIQCINKDYQNYKKICKYAIEKDKNAINFVHGTSDDYDDILNFFKKQPDNPVIIKENNTVNNFDLCSQYKNENIVLPIKDNNDILLEIKDTLSKVNLKKDFYIKNLHYKI